MSLYVDIEKKFSGFCLRAKFEAEQEVMGILGASGCGKSVTLKCIAGIIKPDKGRIALNGVTLFDSEKGINLMPQKRHVGLLFQNYALFPNMTVEKNLMAGIRPWEKDKKKARDQVREFVERFYLTGLEKHRPSELSGGQQQRVALARILLTRPRLLMLDEPFSALDGYLKWKLELELMDILKEFDSTILFVSHSRDEIYRLCSRVCVMEDGRSAPAVSVKAMFEEPKTMAACQLSGCKNYSAARPAFESGREGGTWVLACDWGVELECERPVPENITHIGVRSHAIHVALGEGDERKNVIECRILRIVEDVFHMVVMASPLNGASGPDGSQLRLEMSKEQWAACAGQEGEVIRVFIDPAHIMPLVSSE